MVCTNFLFSLGSSEDLVVKGRRCLVDARTRGHHSRDASLQGTRVRTTQEGTAFTRIRAGEALSSPTACRENSTGSGGCNEGARWWMLAVVWQDSCGGLTDDGAGGGAGVGASMQRAAPTTVGGWRLAVCVCGVRCAVCGVRGVGVCYSTVVAGGRCIFRVAARPPARRD